MKVELNLLNCAKATPTIDNAFFPFHDPVILCLGFVCLFFIVVFFSLHMKSL